MGAKKELTIETARKECAPLAERMALLSDIFLGLSYEAVKNKWGDLDLQPVRMSDRLKAADLLARMRGEYIPPRETEENQVRIEPLPKFETVDDYMRWIAAQDLAAEHGKP